MVVIISTAPVGTGEEVKRIIHERRPDADFAVVSNPELLREVPRSRASDPTGRVSEPMTPAPGRSWWT